MIFAGYMETRYYLPDGVSNYETKLGAVVHDKLVAPLHSHFANFKVCESVWERTGGSERARGRYTDGQTAELRSSQRSVPDF
eukprot:1421257-Pleurochrysis_carterae.AAC.2